MDISRWPTPVTKDEYLALPGAPEFSQGFLYATFEQRLAMFQALLKAIGIEAAVFCCGNQEDWELAVRRRGNRARKRGGRIPPS